jgi:hypothetical protein
MGALFTPDVTVMREGLQKAGKHALAGMVSMIPGGDIAGILLAVVSFNCEDCVNGSKEISLENGGQIRAQIDGEEFAREADARLRSIEQDGEPEGGADRRPY